MKGHTGFILTVMDSVCAEIVGLYKTKLAAKMAFKVWQTTVTDDKWDEAVLTYFSGEKRVDITYWRQIFVSGEWREFPLRSQK